MNAQIIAVLVLIASIGSFWMSAGSFSETYYSWVNNHWVRGWWKFKLGWLSILAITLYADYHALKVLFGGGA